MAKTWIYAASAAAIGGALIGGWLLDPAPPEASPQARQSPAAQAAAAPTAALAAPAADATRMLAPTPVTTPAPRERVTLWQGELRSREGAPRAFPNTWRRSNPPCSTRWRSARCWK